MGAVGWCLEPHDPAVSKLAARREKDHAFVGVMLSRGIVSAPLVRQRLGQTPSIGDPRRATILARLDRWDSPD